MLATFALIASLIIGFSLSKIDFLKEIVSKLKIIPYMLTFFISFIFFFKSIIVLIGFEFITFSPVPIVF